MRFLLPLRPSTNLTKFGQHFHLHVLDGRLSGVKGLSHFKSFDSHFQLFNRLGSNVNLSELSVAP